jgi:hypothetical protein
MEIYELSQSEEFIIKCIREFHFLWNYGYKPSELFLCNARSEYSVTFYNHLSLRKIQVIQKEILGLDIIFKQKTFLGIKTTELSEIAKFKRFPTSLKTLAELVQSDYMHLIMNGNVSK